MTKTRSESMEDYLETIALLSREQPVVRVSQISRTLDVKMPSVTAALKKLSDEGMVNHKKYGYVTLTFEGARIAEQVIRRHDTLRHFLQDILGIGSEIAEEDACKIEHVISAETLNKLSEFIDFVSRCPSGKPEWLNEFEYYSEKGEHSEHCMQRCHAEG